MDAARPTPQSASSVGGSRASATGATAENRRETARRPSSSSLVARARLPSRTSDDGAFVGYNGRDDRRSRRARERGARERGARASRTVARGAASRLGANAARTSRETRFVDDAERKETSGGGRTRDARAGEDRSRRARADRR